MPLIPPLNNVIAIQYQKGNIMLQAECLNSLAQKRINLNYGENVTPSFTVFNIKSGYAIKMNEHTIDASFGVTNILNKTYYAHLDWGRINRPGRSFELFLKYSFSRFRR
jgi:iron complex outermembrane receptor protein